MLSSSLKFQDRSLWVIVPIVLVIHFLIALFFNGLHHEPVILTPKKSVVVHSVKLTPKVVPQKEVVLPVPAKVEVPLKAESPPQPKPAPPKPKVEKKPEVKKPEVKKPEVKKKVQEPKPKPKAEPSLVPKVEKNHEWIAAAKEKIGKIAVPSGTISNNQKLKDIAPIENFITDLAFVDSETTFNVKESAYRDELAMRLKLALKLPEYGEVKVKLTIDRSGKITSMKVLSFQSAKNASFIEQNLPKIKMPPFGDNFKGASDYDFTIILSNE